MIHAISVAKILFAVKKDFISIILLVSRRWVFWVAVFDHENGKKSSRRSATNLSGKKKSGWQQQPSLCTRINSISGQQKRRRSGARWHCETHCMGLFVLNTSRVSLSFVDAAEKSEAWVWSAYSPKIFSCLAGVWNEVFYTVWNLRTYCGFFI